MRHHLEPARANSVDDLGALLNVGDLELLLEEDGRLLVGGFNNASNKEVVRRRRRGMQERQEIDGLYTQHQYVSGV